MNKRQANGGAGSSVLLRVFKGVATFLQSHQNMLEIKKSVFFPPHLQPYTIKNTFILWNTFCIRRLLICHSQAFLNNREFELLFSTVINRSDLTVIMSLADKQPTKIKQKKNNNNKLSIFIFMVHEQCDLCKTVIFFLSAD